jgi:hypothetical protein
MVQFSLLLLPVSVKFARQHTLLSLTLNLLKMRTVRAMHTRKTTSLETYGATVAAIIQLPVEEWVGAATKAIERERTANAKGAEILSLHLIDAFESAARKHKDLAATLRKDITFDPVTPEFSAFFAYRISKHFEEHVSHSILDHWINLMDLCSPSRQPI